MGLKTLQGSVALVYIHSIREKPLVAIITAAAQFNSPAALCEKPLQLSSTISP